MHAQQFWVKCWQLVILLLIYCVFFHFLLAFFCFNINSCLSCSSVWFLCHLLFLVWLSLWMLCLTIGPFIFRFQCTGLHLSLHGIWSHSMHNAHIALKKLQPFVLMLHRMVFPVSGKVVLYIWILLLLKFIYIIKDTVSHFPDYLAAFWV